MDIELLRELLTYEPDTGRLFWKRRTAKHMPSNRGRNTWNARYAGAEAFTADCGGGYRQGSILGKNYRAHQVIWALVHGEWPEVIDHIDGDRSNNRIENLSNGNHADNARNRYTAIGVYWEANRWRAKVGRVHIGRFETYEEAVEARRAKLRELGYSERHGSAAWT